MHPETRLLRFRSTDIIMNGLHLLCNAFEDREPASSYAKHHKVSPNLYKAVVNARPQNFELREQSNFLSNWRIAFAAHKYIYGMLDGLWTSIPKT